MLITGCRLFKGRRASGPTVPRGGRGAFGGGGGKAMNDDEFRRLLAVLELSWEGFRRVRRGVKKRLRRRMVELGCTSAPAYQALVEGSAAERRVCYRLLAVTVTRFLRDAPLWQALTQRLLPDLQARFGPLTAWSAGCAGGEEVYSLRMAWAQGAGRGGAEGLRILASDLLEANLRRARQGVYPGSSLRELPPDWRARWFRPRGRRRWAVDSRLAEGILWVQHDWRTGPPLGGAHLVLLRNSLLTYHRGDREALLRPLARIIPAGGLLVVGRREVLPPGVCGLMAVAAAPGVFRRSGGPRGSLPGG